MTHVEDRAKKRREEKEAERAARGKPPEAPKAQVVTHVPLTDIYADFDFNARSKENVTSEPDSAPGGGLEDLSGSLRTKGQDFPITVRPNTHEKGREHRRNEETRRLEWWWPPYELVDGFRRWVSISGLNADEKLQEHSKETGIPIVPNVPNGMVAAEVRPLDDREAVLLNGRAAVGRNNLEPPDLMTHVVKLTRPPFNMSVAEIAEDQGASLTTIHKYASTGNALLPAILKHWRLGGEFDGVVTNKRASFDDVVEVAKESHEKQPAAYKEALIGRKAKEGNVSWFNAAERSATRVGAFLARLELEGIVSLRGKPWEECVFTLVKIPVGVRGKPMVKEKVGAAILRGYEAEKNRDATKRESQS